MTALGKSYEQEKERYADLRVAEAYVGLIEKNPNPRSRRKHRL